MSEQPPELWPMFLHHLGSTPELARALWEHLPQRERISWHFGTLRNRADNLSGALARTERLARVLTPGILLAACLRLAPETGQERPTDIRALEERILQCTSNGQWRW